MSDTKSTHTSCDDSDLALSAISTKEPNDLSREEQIIEAMRLIIDSVFSSRNELFLLAERLISDSQEVSSVEEIEHIHIQFIRVACSLGGVDEISSFYQQLRLSLPHEEVLWEACKKELISQATLWFLTHYDQRKTQLQTTKRAKMLFIWISIPVIIILIVYNLFMFQTQQQLSSW